MTAAEKKNIWVNNNNNKIHEEILCFQHTSIDVWAKSYTGRLNTGQHKCEAFLYAAGCMFIVDHHTVFV